MKRLRMGLLVYNVILLALLFVAGVASGITTTLGVLLLLLPVLIYFGGKLINVFLHLDRKRLPQVMLVGRLLYMYSAVMTLLMFLASVVLIHSLVELLLSLVFLPLTGYFILNAYLGYRRWKRALYLLRSANQKKNTLQKENKKIETKGDQGITQAGSDFINSQTTSIEGVEVEELSPEISEEVGGVTDIKRRQFLKLVGGGSLGMIVLLFLSPQKASAAFFGSVPGPGTVALKDTTGTPIDPKEKAPTDGYTISQIDDAGSPAYYGFVHKSGAWYISREESDGSYRYAKGATNFADNWANRVLGLSYGYFNVVFGV